jgi:hypothetical protein
LSEIEMGKRYTDRMEFSNGDAPAATGRASTGRRSFRYSLRTFLVLVTAICITLGLYVKRQRDRHMAIETIKSWGGVVDFLGVPSSIGLWESMQRESALIGGVRPLSPPEQQPVGAGWQQRLFGKYYGSSVFRVAFGQSTLSPHHADIDIRVLHPLTEVKQLSLGPPIDDAALGRLRRLPQLETLNLMEGTNISDRGLACLARLPNLKHLQIIDGRFTAAGMKRIGACRILEGLTLYSCDFTDADLAHLSGLQKLAELSLERTPVSEAGLDQLRRLRGLKVLRVSRTNVSDEAAQKFGEEMSCRVHSYYAGYN